MTWEGLFVILALQFRSLLKILDLLHENESMHCIHWRAQRNLWLISTQEESILLVYHRLFDHQHYHRFAQKHVIWVFSSVWLWAPALPSWAPKIRTVCGITQRDLVTSIYLLWVSYFCIVSLTILWQLMWCFDIRNWPKKTRLQAKCHLSSEHHRKGGRGCKIGLQILGHEYLHS